MRKLTLADVKITVTPEEEDIHWTDSSLGYDESLPEVFQEMVDKHGLWGWCCVKVTAAWRGLKGNAYLGACSYESEADFKQEGSGFEDMCLEALERLNVQVLDHLDEASEMRKALEERQ